jgi:predicted porin
MSPARADADITIYDRDGWSFYTKGFVAAHYQLMLGDATPSTTHGVLVEQQDQSSSQDPRDNSILLSRVRSGFIGTQIGFGMNRQISEDLKVTSLLAVNLADVSSGRGQDPIKGVDFREAWASLSTPFGSLKFGRMFSIFGSASAQVTVLAYRYGVGNPCFAETTTIACGSVGAGPLYAGFDAQLRYTSPRLAGFEFQFAVSDPVRGIDYTLTPLPRLDAELNYEHEFSPSTKLRVTGQGIGEVLERLKSQTELQKATVWGVMGSAVLNAGDLSVGGGGWTGEGIGARVIMEAQDPASPIAYDKTNYELRLFRGFFGNVAYDYHGSALAVGGGIVFVRSTPGDLANPNQFSVLAQQAEGHIVFTQRIDAVVLTAEYMRWMAQWYYGEKQDLNFTGVGANYAW